MISLLGLWAKIQDLSHWMNSVTHCSVSFWAALFTLFTVFYQRSFHYAITNHRVIFTQHLIIPGDGRRILFDNINEVRTQRTMMGAMFGYNTIICDTGSQLGIGEDAMSVSVGSAKVILQTKLLQTVK